MQRVDASNKFLRKDGNPWEDYVTTQKNTIDINLELFFVNLHARHFSYELSGGIVLSWIVVFFCLFVITVTECFIKYYPSGIVSMCTCSYLRAAVNQLYSVVTEPMNRFLRYVCSKLYVNIQIFWYYEN